MLVNRSRLLTAVVLGSTLAASSGETFAKNRYTHTTSGYRHYGSRHRGIGAGGLVAGAALGILGAATAGIAADRYYNGYPAYSYGPGYGGAYGYDYHPGYGYYGPY